jgi:hypothetical protein
MQSSSNSKFRSQPAHNPSSSSSPADQALRCWIYQRQPYKLKRLPSQLQLIQLTNHSLHQRNHRRTMVIPQSQASLQRSKLLITQSWTIMSLRTHCWYSLDRMTLSATSPHSVYGTDQIPRIKVPRYSSSILLEEKQPPFVESIASSNDIIQPYRKNPNPMASSGPIAMLQYIFYCTLHKTHLRIA